MTILIPRRYSFHDEFNTVLPSASLNNSVCEPGPGNRTVTDTETCLSIIPNYGSSLADQTGVTFGGSNNRCSYADNYAWIDFPTGFNAAAHAGLGRIVVMYDSAERACWGFLGAAGAGETVGSNLIVNSGFDSNTNGWSAASGAIASVSGGQSGNCLELTASGTPCQAYQDNFFSSPIGSLFVYSLYVKSGTAGNITFKAYLTTNTRTGVSSLSGTSSGSWTLVTILGVSKTDTSSISAWNLLGSTGTLLFDELLVKQVLTPSATGCLVYRDAACTVNGWHRPTAFNMNDTAYTFNVYQPSSGGKLFFMGGKATAANGDPGLWDGEAITRQTGLICAFKVNPKNASSIMQVGLGTSRSSVLGANAVRIGDGVFKWYENSTTGQPISLAINSTEHIIAIVLMAVGVKYFMKVGSGYFKKLWESATNNTATLYRGISTYSLVGKVDFLRQPKTLWLPTPLLSDSFTGSAGTNDGRLSDGLGHARTTGLGAGGSGVAWSGASGAVDGSGRLVITPTLGAELATGNLVVGNWYLITATESNHFGTGLGVGYTFRATATTALDANNKVKQITLSTCYNTVSLTTKDVTLKTAFQETTGKQTGIIFGLSADGNSFIIAYHDGNGNIKLEICEAGTYTTKSTVAIAYSSDAELVVRRDNKEIWVWYNNTLIGSGPTTTLSDSENTNLSGLKAGLFSTDSANSFAYATAYYVGTNGEYTILENLIGQ